MISHDYQDQHLYQRQISLLRVFVEHFELARKIDLADNNDERGVMEMLPKLDIGTLAEVIAALNTGIEFLSDADVNAVLLDTLVAPASGTMAQKMIDANQAAEYLKTALETSEKQHKNYGGHVKAQMNRLADLASMIRSAQGSFSQDKGYMILLANLIGDVSLQVDPDSWDIPF